MIGPANRSKPNRKIVNRESTFWSCPACGREFGFRQAHVCVPPLSVDAYFAARPEYERPIFEAVREHLTSLGPLIIEPVNIGVLFKARRTFAELRPKTRWVNLTFGLDRPLNHPRITRTTRMKTGGGW
jgi:hypothetical protein